MRDLSLHILDLIENSIRAQATVICVSVVGNPERDLLEILVEDNGCGFSVPQEVATDPFFTTKAGKKVGLGLSLLKAAADRANGELTITKSRLGGARVRVSMQLSHVDRSPLGDLAATLSSVVCTNPQLDIRCRFLANGKEFKLSVPEVAGALHAEGQSGLAVAREVNERIRTGLMNLQFVP